MSPQRRADRHLVVPLAGLLALLFAAAGASSDQKQECAAAYTDGQTLRKAGKLRQARARLAVCAAPSCPAVVQGDCEQWLGQVDAMLPTLVIDARDAAGADVTDVRVLLDGTELTARIDGRAIAVDPGEHTLRFVRGGEALEQRVVLREGEKFRKVTVQFGAATPATSASAAASVVTPPLSSAPPLAPPSAPPVEQEPDASRPVPVAVWVLGGVGIVAVGAFAFLGATGKSDVSSLRSSCAPRCAPDSVDAAKSKLLFADLALVAGVGALGVATWLYVTRPEKGAVRIGITPVPGGGGALVAGAFP